MCAPSVLHEVRQDLSRRGFLTALGTSIAAMTAVTVAGQAQEKPVRLPKGFRDIHDLTHTLSPATPVFPGYKPMQMVERFSVARDGFHASELTLGEHTGTHLDGPIHFVPNGMSADRIPVDRLFAPLAVVSIKARADKDPDAMVRVDDLTSWEKTHGRIPSGAFVAMYSGWDARVNDARRFLNADANNTLHFPGFSEEAARFLVQQRDIAGVGVDTLSLDTGAARTFVAHLAILGAGKYGVEALANLGAVPPAGATVIVGGPKHRGASGGPLRIFAVA